jgi:quercetin dioxygenase-like cupin family protein
VFEDGNGIKETLKQGDYVNIEPLVDHWMKSVTDSHLLLIK